MSEPVVLYEKKGPIAVITVNRPEKMNAYNNEVLTLEEKYFEDFRDDPNLYVAILTGAGDKAFCAGGDLRRTLPREGDPPPIPPPKQQFHHGDIKIYKPIIAAINGYCLSGGLAAALICDVRIAAEHATFGAQQVRYGARSPATVQLLTHSIGLSNGLYLSITGVRIDAQEALRMGIIHKIVPYRDLMPAAFEMAETILLNCPTHVRIKKEHALKCLTMPYDEARAWGGYLESLLPPEETKEGVSAFFGKRKPDWSKITKKK